jgi:hypothetical protein
LPSGISVALLINGKLKLGPAAKENHSMTRETKDDRDILELLKQELAFIEKGGYGRSVSTPWLPKSTFEDSLTCLNYGYSYRAHPCSECQLTDLADREMRSEEAPCHFIPLNAAGETIEDLEAQENQSKLEANLKQWMRKKIKEVEDSRTTQAA